MRLLFITQKVDQQDGPLGFVHEWIQAFARMYERVTVICLEKGEVSLLPYVSLFSLGKETRPSRVLYVLRFWKYTFQNRGSYDAVLVHMNQEYIFLGFLLWKFLGKRVGLWYNHTAGSWRTRLAMSLSDVVFHTSPYAFTAGTSKSIRMPAGIDIARFVPHPTLRNEEEILYIGRIAPIKGLHILLEALRLCGQEGLSFTVHVYGEALPEHKDYEEQVRKQAEGLPGNIQVSFHGPIANIETPLLYSKAAFFVNLTPPGNYDKTVLEAMACGTLVVLSSPAFADIVAPEFFFAENDPRSLADALFTAQALSAEDREVVRARYHKYVQERHSLQSLMQELQKYLS